MFSSKRENECIGLYIIIRSLIMYACVGRVINEIITEINVLLYRVNDMMT